ncbi:hypothetical protein CDAR_190441 [Caerostris darwini]|uniref:Uncharacterized protein n=1 Tax=Caerostris darwini TaxID=1538125 RepID=A0AAV4MLZ7_9ARAC|nr:hypothetical protein CDAR_190441 [Caerostris darwini]
MFNFKVLGSFKTDDFHHIVFVKRQPPKSPIYPLPFLTLSNMHIINEFHDTVVDRSAVLLNTAGRRPLTCALSSSSLLIGGTGGKHDA